MAVDYYNQALALEKGNLGASWRWHYFNQALGDGKAGMLWQPLSPGQGVTWIKARGLGLRLSITTKPLPWTRSWGAKEGMARHYGNVVAKHDDWDAAVDYYSLRQEVGRKAGMIGLGRVTWRRRLKEGMAYGNLGLSPQSGVMQISASCRRRQTG